MQGHPEAVIPSIQAKLLPMMLANFAVWPIAHLINFKFIPSQQRCANLSSSSLLLCKAAPSRCPAQKPAELVTRPCTQMSREHQPTPCLRVAATVSAGLSLCNSQRHPVRVCRILYINCCQILWSAYLSNLSASGRRST